MVEEVEDDNSLSGGCELRMVDIQPEDGGQYLVIFPARLADNVKMQLEVKVKAEPSRTGEFVVLVVAVVVVVNIILICIVAFLLDITLGKKLTSHYT